MEPHSAGPEVDSWGLEYGRTSLLSLAKGAGSTLLMGHGWRDVFKFMFRLKHVFLLIIPVLPFEIQSLGLIILLLNFLLKRMSPRVYVEWGGDLSLPLQSVSARADTGFSSWHQAAQGLAALGGLLNECMIGKLG